MEWYQVIFKQNQLRCSSLQLGAGAVNIIMLPTLLIPVTWFPDHKGLVSEFTPKIYIQLIFGLPQVLGIVTSGFGLSSTVFSPLQTLLINPSNLPPLRVYICSIKLINPVGSSLRNCVAHSAV